MSEKIESKPTPSHSVAADMKVWLSTAFTDDLNTVFKIPENDTESAKINKIRKINFWEFVLTLGIMFTVMWTFWWQGILQDNKTLETIGYVILGIIGIWALLFSPFYHYKLEKGLTYRRGYLGLNYEQNKWTAWFEERGFGSLMQYWKETLKDPKNSHLVNFTTFWVEISILLYMVFRKSGITNLGKNFGITDDIARRTATAAGLGIGFQIVATCLFIYSLVLILKWTATGDKDQPKKIILMVIHTLVFALSFVFAGIYALKEDEVTFVSQWGFGWNESLVVYQTTFANPNMSQFAYTLIGISVVLFFLLKYFLLGILIRFDNLKTAFYQFLFIMVITIIVIGTLNLVMGLESVNAYMVAHHVDNMSETPTLDNMWYIFDNTALASRESFTFASLFANWGQYVYWGAVQQLLFLSYWNTLLTKVFKNKHINAALSSLSFGLIHFPSWPLMILTIVAGYFWGLAWQRNACRNLFIIGASHGFGGTLVAKLIPITMSVGPSNMA